MNTKLIPDPPPSPYLTNTSETQLIQVSDLLRQANARLCECSHSRLWSLALSTD